MTSGTWTWFLYFLYFDTDLLLHHKNKCLFKMQLYESHVYQCHIQVPVYGQNFCFNHPPILPKLIFISVLCVMYSLLWIINNCMCNSSLTCQMTAGMTSICPQTEANSHPVNLRISSSQHIEYPGIIGSLH